MKTKISRVNIALAAVMAAGLALSALGAYSIYRVQKNRLSGEFDAMSQDRADLVSHAMNDDISALSALGYFYASSASVERDEFRTFTAGALSRRPSIIEFRWLARVKDANRKAFEEEARREGIADFEIKEIEKGGQGFVRAGQREEYFPVYYIEASPYYKHDVSGIIGLDSASFPERWTRMRLARDTGEITSAPEVEYLTGGAPAEIKSATRVFLPVYRNGLPHGNIGERRDSLTGFAVLLYNIGDMAERAISVLSPGGIDVYFYREVPEGGNDSFRVVDANKMAGKMFGFSREEMVVQPPAALFNESGEYAFSKAKRYFEAARSGDPQVFEWLMRDRSGRMFWVEISMRRAAIGGAFRILSVVRDVTERRRLTEMKDDFMSMVSHELRTPLGIIKEGISLVLEGVAGEVSEKQKEVLGMAKANTDRPARLIHQVLDFQKLNAGKMEFKLQEHDINELMKEVCRHSQSVADKKGLALKAEVDQDLPRLKFDRDRIVEVLMNLVNNAIKFTAKGTITVRTARKGAYAEASVSDMGCGIKEEDLEKLFQRFAQLERTPGGSGLGLAISKEIVEAHKGSIRAESVFGNGSAFSFTLPI